MTAQLRRGQPGTRPDRLTANEDRFLEGLLVPAPEHDDCWSPVELIASPAQGGRFAGMGREGLHQTGASLRRKGFVTRHQKRDREPVRYQITGAGRRALLANTATAREATR